MNPTILVVDDEESICRFFQVTLRREGYNILTAGSIRAALKIIRDQDYDLVLSDIKLGDGVGLEVLEASKQKDADIPVLMMTAYASPETAVEAMKLGAADYLTKPFNVDEVRVIIRNNLKTRSLVAENKRLKEALGQNVKTKMVFQSPVMVNLIESLKRISKMDTTVLITGESGTGKELIAKTVHEYSLRGDAAFVSVNCGALPENLLESELFGYEKGAFTGAEKRRMGLCESARGGTLFLDEIGEMPIKMQVKLLRVLQERMIRRVGGTEEIPVDFRLVAATHRDLKKEIEEGRFREDLYYRINVIPIHLPPLRERREDIALLIRHFLKKFSERFGEDPKDVAGPALDVLLHHEWPGNVRQLENTVERLVALTPGNEIRMENLPPEFKSEIQEQGEIPVRIPDGEFDLEKFLDEVRFRYMEAGLEKAGGIQSHACELLGMSFRSFRYYVGKGKEKGFFQNY